MEWIAIITAGIAALTSLLTLILNRTWAVKDKKDEHDDECKQTLTRIEKKLDAHIQADAEDSMRQARAQFLIFADELSRGVAHSKEHFEAIVEMVDSYDRFCKSNPDFPNSKARAAEKLIKDSYQNRLNKNDWL